MRRKEFLENVAVPLLGIAVVMFIVYLFCVENGVCDYRKLWIVSGIPFGIQKMYFWMIPKGFDIGGTVGMFAFNRASRSAAFHPKAVCGHFGNPALASR